MPATRILERFVVTTTAFSVGAIDVTPPLTLDGYNTVQFDMVVLNADYNLTVKYQHSDDLENWTTASTLGTTFGIGYSLLPAITAVKSGYVRLSMLLTGAEEAGFAILALGVNLSNQAPP